MNRINCLCVVILIIFIIILYSYNDHNIENFELLNEYKTDDYVDLIDGKPVIWMYWENITNKPRPVYLDLCQDTIMKNCSNSFNVIVLNERSVKRYLPELRLDLNKKLSVQQKADYIRYALLSQYGGVWFDSDICCLRNIKPLVEKLQTHDYVGFGCHNDECSKTMNGYPYPTNWAMISRRNSIYMNKCLKNADLLLNSNNKDYFKKHYFVLGRNLMFKTYMDLNKNNNYQYYHHTSRCVERDSKGSKITNKRLLSNEKIDDKCKKSFYFVPLYNTAPGFPKWFKNASRDDILKSQYLVSRLIRQALNIQ